MTNEDKKRESDIGSEPIPHVRAENVRSFWRAVLGGGVLAVIVTLFVSLGVANRDYTKQIGDNLSRVADQWNKNFEKLADRVYELEKWSWARGRQK